MSDPLPAPSLPPAERWRCESRHCQAPSYLRQSPLLSHAPLPVAFVSTAICTRPDNRRGRRNDPLAAPSLPSVEIRSSSFVSPSLHCDLRQASHVLPSHNPAICAAASPSIFSSPFLSSLHNQRSAPAQPGNARRNNSWISLA